jgi:hypothetical protein
MTPSLDDSDDFSCVDLYAVVEGRARPNPSTLRSSKPTDAGQEKKAREADAALSKQIRESILGKNNNRHGEADFHSIEKPKGYSTGTTTTTTDVASTSSATTTTTTTTSHIVSLREQLTPHSQERKSVHGSGSVPIFDDLSLQVHSSRPKGRTPRRNSMDHASLSLGGRNEDDQGILLTVEPKATATSRINRRKSLDNSSFLDLPSNVSNGNNDVSSHSMTTIRISNSSTNQNQSKSHPKSTSFERNTSSPHPKSLGDQTTPCSSQSTSRSQRRGSIQNNAIQSCLPNLPLLPHSDTTNNRTETAKTIRKKEIQFSKHNGPSENNSMLSSKYPRSRSVKEESTMSPTPNLHPRSKSWTSEKMKHFQMMEKNKMEESNLDNVTRDTNSSSLTTPTTTTTTYRWKNSHYQPESMTEASQYPISKQSRSQHVDSFADKGMDEKLEQSPQPPPKASLSSGQVIQPSRRQTDGPNISTYARGSSASSQMNPPMLLISVSRDDPASPSVAKPRTSRTSTAIRKTRSRSPILSSSAGTSNNVLNLVQHRRQSQSPSVARRKSGTVTPVSSSTTTTTTIATNRNARIQSQGDPSSYTRNTTSTTIATSASKSTYLTQLFATGPKTVSSRNNNSSDN